MVTGENRRLADDAAIQRTVEALEARNIGAVVVGSSKEANEKLMSMVPDGSEVFCSTSETLETIGFMDYLSNSPGIRDLGHEAHAEADLAARLRLMREGGMSEFYVGSVQAIAETGELVVASASGSQIGAYAYGSPNVILVAGTQKICPSLSEAIDRVRGFTVEKHDAWLGERGRGPAPIGKMLIIEKENAAGRINVILIKENLGW